MVLELWSKKATTFANATVVEERQKEEGRLKYKGKRLKEIEKVQPATCNMTGETKETEGTEERERGSDDVMMR